jgi:ribonucleoside-diphosphate reductase alpha chain
MQEFIDGTEGIKHMDRAVRFARRHRAIGILGWHSYLQSNMIPFESAEATTIRADLAKTIQERSYAASTELADRFGAPPVLQGYGRRNATTMLAPTKSSSFVPGQVSPSIEPIKSNYHVQDQAKMKVIYKNPSLTALLDEKGKNTDEVWEQIALRDGLVQHLDFLSEREKDVVQTFSEISQMAVITQAAARQKHIDQSQSLNLAINPNAPPARERQPTVHRGLEKGRQEALLRARRECRPGVLPRHFGVHELRRRAPLVRGGPIRGRAAPCPPLSSCHYRACVWAYVRL